MTALVVINLLCNNSTTYFYEEKNSVHFLFYQYTGLKIFHTEKPKTFQSIQ